MNLQYKKALLYKRVSTDEQAEKGYSLLDQEERLRKFCEMLHIQVIHFFDDDYSAKSFHRPGWKLMMQFIKQNKGAANLLLFTNWSRFSRSENMGETYMMIDQLHRSGIEPQAIEQQLDLSIPENRLVLAFYIASPMVENLRRSNNTMNGIRRSMKSGRWCNNAPYGYKHSRDADGRPLIIKDPEKAKVIEQIFIEYLNDVPLKEIIKNSGVTNRGNGTIQRIITNPLYGGLIKIAAYKDEHEQTIKGIHEPIVSEEIYYSAKAKFNDSTIAKPKVMTQELSLRGIIHCQKCDGLLTGCRSRGKTGRHWWYYKCNKCSGENYSADKSHHQMLKILNAISLKPKYISFLTKQVDLELKAVVNEKMELSNKLKREITAMELKLQSLEDKYISNQIEFTTYDKWYPVYRREISTRRAELESCFMDREELLKLYHDALPSMMSLESMYSNCDLTSKQELLKLLFPAGLIKEKDGYRTPYLFSMFSAEAATVAGLVIGEQKETGHERPDFLRRSLSEIQIEPLLRFIVRRAA